MGSYATDIATKDVSGLTAGTTYYFNVIVKDEAGNKTCYTAKSVTTMAADKTLIADTTNNDVDHDIEITFASDAAFEDAITAVSFNGTALTVTTDYVVSSGKVTLKPSGGNAALRILDSGNVIITASGYNNSSVSQTITAGAVNSLTITTQPVVGAASGDALVTQPVVTLKDQYNNTCANGPSAGADVVATAKAGTGSWTIGGTTTKAASLGVTTFTNLTCSLTFPGDGAITFTSGVKTVDSNTFTIPTKAGVALTADTTNNDVDHDIEITFASDAAFTGAITGVSFNGNTLTANQYTKDTVNNNKITLHPSSADNTYLRIPATGNVIITASGYNNSSVLQTINIGAVANLTVSQDITAPTTNGGQFATQPVITLTDIYGNTCTYDSVTTVTVSKRDIGTWTLTGTTTVTASSGIVTLTDLGATNTYQITNAQLAFNATGLPETTSATVTLPASTSSDGPVTPAVQTTQTIGITVIVNGQEETAGTETVTVSNGQTSVKLVVDANIVIKKMEEVIQQQLNTNIEENKNIVEVPVATKDADSITVALTGDIVNKMGNNEFTLSVKSKDIDYNIPAKEIGIEKVAETLGVAIDSLQNIEVEVKIEKIDEKLVEQIIANASVQNYEIIFPPVSFTVVAKTTSTSGEENEVTISTFNQYVERVMEIPEGIDPSKITTGIVINPDGTVSHIPTDIFEKDGKYYARLSSLTNSAYSVIWNPIVIKSVENHWSKNSDDAITRGEFAEYITKALGLYRTKVAKDGKFTDVKASNDLADAITIATEYSIISGYPDGTFKPNAKISREEAMAIYARAMDVVKLKEADNNGITNYKDAKKVSGWAYSSVKKVLSANVFNGRTKDTIAPQSTLTYAEAASAIRNMLVQSGLINR